MAESPVRRAATVAPLSFAQERLWFIDAASPGSSTYNVPLFMWWHEPVGVDALRTALNLVVQRHEILRTTYELRDGKPVQVIADEIADLVEVVHGVASDQVLADAHQRAAEPFDLAGDQPVKCVVWPDAKAVLLSIHHIAVDGWALSTLFTEIAQAYQTGRLDRPELPIQYADYAVWDRQTLSRRDMDRRVDELLAIPGDLALAGRRQPVTTTGERPGAVHRFPITVDVADVARRLRATPFVVLFAAFQAVLRRWADREEFLVSAVMANRTHPALDDLVGFFINTVPLRCRVQQDRTFRELVREVRAESFGALTYQRIPFDQLTAAARPRGAGNLASVAFVLQNTPTPDYPDGPKWTRPVELHTGTAMYELTLIVENGPDGYACTLEYDVECYDATTVTTIAENITTLLAAAVADPDRLVADLPITAQGARSGVLTGRGIPLPGETVLRLRADEAGAQLLSELGAYVLGRDQEEVPAGVPGELYLAGAGTGLGDALGGVERTAAAFLPDRFGTGLMYRTGDKVVLGTDGRLEFLGRYDDEVTILGNRIDPNRVRKLIEEHPAVRTATVRAEGDPPRLVANLVLSDVDELPTRDEIVRPLLRRLPTAVIPADVYAGLSETHATRLPDAEQLDVTLTSQQQQAVGLVRRCVPSAGELRPDSNFFAIGGHSLLAVSMIAEAERHWGITVPLRDFLADPTIAGLGRLLATAPPAAIRRTVAQDRYPATPVQQRLWFVDRIREQRNAYLLPAIIEFTGPVDHDRLRRSVDDTLARHPALRSRFELDHKLKQVFYRTDGPPATAKIVDRIEDDMDDHIDDLCWTPFDLAADAPARAEIIIDRDHTVLVVVSHHMVFDGWSLDLLLKEIAGRYRSEMDTLPMPVHPAQVAQPTAPADEMIARLAGAPTDVALPLDRPRPEVQTSHGAWETASLQADRTQRLRAVTAELGCSTFVTSAALLAATLARDSGQRDFLFAIPWSGRDAAGSAEAIGMFVNILVLRVDLRASPTWRELLQTVIAESKACYRDADVPFDALVAALHPERDLSRPPLTPVYVGAFDGPPEPPGFGNGITTRFRPFRRLNVKYELDFVATDRGSELEFAASYATDLMDAPTVARLLAGVLACAGDLAADPDAAVLRRTQ